MFFCPSVGVHGCPIELSPSRVVVKYGDRVSINCTSKLGNDVVPEIGWEAKEGGKGLTATRQLTWTVESLKNWDISPWCYTWEGDKQCKVTLDIVLYSKSFFYLSRTIKNVNGTIP